MAGKITEMITGEQVLMVVVIVLFLAYFVYKEWPAFRQRVSASAVREKEEDISEKTISERLDAIEKKCDGIEKKFDEKFAEINGKFNADFDRINSMERQQKKLEKMQRNSLEERGIIMRALLALMDSASESEKITESENEIQNYLVRQSHQEGAE